MDKFYKRETKDNFWMKLKQKYDIYMDKFESIDDDKDNE